MAKKVSPLAPRVAKKDLEFPDKAKGRGQMGGMGDFASERGQLKGKKRKKAGK